MDEAQGPCELDLLNHAIVKNPSSWCSIWAGDLWGCLKKGVIQGLGATSGRQLLARTFTIGNVDYIACELAAAGTVGDNMSSLAGAESPPLDGLAGAIAMLFGRACIYEAMDSGDYSDLASNMTLPSSRDSRWWAHGHMQAGMLAFTAVLNLKLGKFILDGMKLLPIFCKQAHQPCLDSLGLFHEVLKATIDLSNIPCQGSTAALQINSAWH